MESSGPSLLQTTGVEMSTALLASVLSVLHCAVFVIWGTDRRWTDCMSLHMFPQRRASQAVEERSAPPEHRQLRTATVAFVMQRVDGDCGVERLSCKARLSLQEASE